MVVRRARSTPGYSAAASDGYKRQVLDAGKSGLQATDMGCFPLVPFSNRIADGRFCWANQSYQLPLNAPPEPHAHHGIGWQSPWEVTETAGHKTVLLLESYDLDKWPWPFRVQQEIELGPDRLAIDLTLTTLGSGHMHGGFGICTFSAS